MSLIYGSNDADPEHIWYIGNSKPYNSAGSNALDDDDHINYVEASGQELEYICEHFKDCHIPIPPCYIVRWYGDMAKFIMGNL